jgi:hypothetical protein
MVNIFSSPVRGTKTRPDPPSQTKTAINPLVFHTAQNPVTELPNSPRDVVQPPPRSANAPVAVSAGSVFAPPPAPQVSTPVADMSPAQVAAFLQTLDASVDTLELIKTEVRRPPPLPVEYRLSCHRLKAQTSASLTTNAVRSPPL